MFFLLSDGFFLFGKRKGELTSCIFFQRNFRRFKTFFYTKMAFLCKKTIGYMKLIVTFVPNK